MFTRTAPQIAPGPRLPYVGDLLGRARQARLSAWVAVVPLVFILGVIFVAIFAPWISPHPAQGAGESNLVAILQPPSHTYPLGTDELGRDILSRIFYGARVSLLTSFIVVAIAIVVGVLIGAAAGYSGGIVETILMRLTDFFLAFPSLLLAMAIAVVIGPSLKNMILALAVSWWPWYARLVHGQAVVLRHLSFVRAARVAGVKPFTILIRHIVPNTITPVLIQGTSDIGSAIIAAAALSFLGLGAQPPTADWGSMVSLGREYILVQWWYVTFPGLAIFLTAIAFNLLGDTLRDINDASARRA